MMLFFDIDGTLLDQRAAEAAAAADFLANYAHLLPFRCSPAELCVRWRALREQHLPEYLGNRISYREYHRRRIRDLCGANGDMGDHLADELFNAFLRPYRRAWRLFDDTLPALGALAGAPVGALSNGNSAQQRLKLRRTGLLERFSIVLISEDLGVAKPAREFFLQACRRAAQRPADCIYVGDRLETDIFSSRAAGLRGVWLNRGEATTVRDAGETVSSLLELGRFLQQAVTR